MTTASDSDTCIFGPGFEGPEFDRAARAIYQRLNLSKMEGENEEIQIGAINARLPTNDEEEEIARGMNLLREFFVLNKMGVALGICVMQNMIANAFCEMGVSHEDYKKLIIVSAEMSKGMWE